jgi:hypothetical protein
MRQDRNSAIAEFAAVDKTIRPCHCDQRRQELGLPLIVAVR